MASQTTQTFLIAPTHQQAEQSHLTRRTAGHRAGTAAGRRRVCTLQPGPLCGFASQHPAKTLATAPMSSAARATDSAGDLLLVSRRHRAGHNPISRSLRRSGVGAKSTGSLSPTASRPSRRASFGQGSFPATTTTTFRSDYQTDGCPPIAGEYSDDELAWAVAFLSESRRPDPHPEQTKRRKRQPDHHRHYV